MLLLLGGVAIESINTLNLLAAQMLLSDADYSKVFQPVLLQTLSMFFLDLGHKGGTIVGLFHGIWLFPLGYLVFKSGFLSRVLGILLIVDGFCLLICLFQIFLFPGYEKLTYQL